MRYDIIVIGSGPAGQKAALQGAKAGKKVAIIENNGLGGGCVHYGTLPSKSLRESVYRWSLGSRGKLAHERDTHGLTSAPARGPTELPDMKRLWKRKDRVVSGEVAVVRDQLTRNGIDIYQGHARLVSRHEVWIENKDAQGEKKKPEKLKGDFIVIATGARPSSPSALTVDGKKVFDSDSILKLKKIPRSMVVLGGGVIGCEYASMFLMAGTKVHLVDKRHEVLASVDREIVDTMVEQFEDRGLELILKAEAAKVERAKEQVVVHLTNGRKIKVDTVLVCLGRIGNVENLGLKELGVEINDRGLIKVDYHFRTSVENIYAVGDVIGAPALAATSMEQGRIAVRHFLGFDDTTLSPLYPYGIYTIPEISMVGPTEEELKAKGVEFVAGKARYRELARGQIVGDHWGLLKLLVEKQSQKILAVHIIGDNAAELVHIGQAVMAFGGDAHYFIKSVFNYPTLAEAYKTAAFHAINTIKGRATKRE